MAPPQPLPLLIGFSRLPTFGLKRAGMQVFRGPLSCEVLSRSTVIRCKWDNAFVAAWNISLRYKPSLVGVKYGRGHRTGHPIESAGLGLGSLNSLRSKKGHLRSSVTSAVSEAPKTRSLIPSGPNFRFMLSQVLNSTGHPNALPTAPPIRQPRKCSRICFRLLRIFIVAGTSHGFCGR